MCTAEVTDNAEIGRRAKQANSIRQSILDELRQEKLVTPLSSVDCLNLNETTATSSDHPLFVFIKQVFTERLSNTS